ncbi:MAG: NPCBM/NEW2 domain-containing protein [Armatimonadota bacterium]|nr:NPCBM/NEW2 domain-containing protein [bacterium]
MRYTNLIVFAMFVCALLMPITALCADSAGVAWNTLPENGMWLENVDLSGMEQGWGSPGVAKNCSGDLIRLSGVTYTHGVGTHALSELRVDLDGTAEKFESMVGVDDCVGKTGSVVFQVWVDGVKAADSGIMRGGDAAKVLSADLLGAKYMDLIVLDAGDYVESDHADWAGARFILVADAKSKPKAYVMDKTPMPIASGVGIEPRINGPRVVGTTPGRPFLFMIPATGEGPLKFLAEGLPDDLTIDTCTGIITGAVKKAGIYKVDIMLVGTHGSVERELTIVAGDHKLAQTPPMGWNSWNVWANNLDAEKVRAAADWMIKSGLASHGYQYINIDDCWQGERDADGVLKQNEKFGDMKALADYVHSKGLKLGIYSSPGPKTCAQYAGSYLHEEQDAKTWAQWGMDYVKYDWCSYEDIAGGHTLEKLQKPYTVMRGALDKCDRDIVYSLCQYGMGDVWQWGEEMGGNLWRTTGDITDTWSSMSNIGFGQSAASPYAKPGHWNDPDMLIVGRVGWGNPHPTRLNPNEQITHITLWSLLAAPLLIGCDMTQMDQFTIDILSNDEVIEVDQDPLGKAANRVSTKGATEIWSRPLWDGTIAVGLFNRGRNETPVTVDWSEIGLSGTHHVRDLWQKKNLGEFKDSYSVMVKPHGCALVKISK